MGKRFLKASVFVFRSGTGYTLVEVLVAMTILMVGMLAVAGMFCYSNNAFGSGRYIIQATDLAYNRVSDIKMCSYSTVVNTTTLKNQFANSTTINGLKYFYNLSTNQIGNLPAARVKVIVRWSLTQNGRNGNHSVSLTTISTGKMQNYSSTPGG